LGTNEPYTLRDEYSWSTEILDSEYEHAPASLDDVIRTWKKIHVKEQQQLNKLLQKYEYLFGGILGEFNMQY
jgi:hypothetical protein